MKTLVVALATLIGLAIALVLAHLAFIEIGREVVTLRTPLPDGGWKETRLWVVDDEGATWLDIIEITLQVGAGIALLAFAFQRCYRVRTNGVETALFATAGILLVLPTVVAAILKPIIGVDISGYMPLFPQIGLHMGYTVIMALVLFLIAHTMQRTRAAALAPS